MKRFVLILAAAVAALTISSCKKDNGTKTVTVTVSVDESAVEAGIAKPDSYVITVTNNSTTTAVTANTENGKAEFSGLVPGIYSVAANAVVVTDGRQYVFTGTEASVDATADATVTIKVSAAKESALVFKEIYYTGCKIGEGEYDTYFRDQFWEVYNNSAETVYADGLCITTLSNNYASWDWSTIYEYDIPNPEKYVFVKTVWQIPGTGNQYPIKPGESIVIAQWGTDHTAETLGTSNSINLSGADFEAILGESTLWNGTVITDNKAINMDRVIETGFAMPQWLVSVGDDAIVLLSTRTLLPAPTVATPMPAKFSVPTSSTQSSGVQMRKTASRKVDCSFLRISMQDSSSLALAIQERVSPARWLTPERTEPSYTRTPTILPTILRRTQNLRSVATEQAYLLGILGLSNWI